LTQKPAYNAASNSEINGSATQKQRSPSNRTTSSPRQAEIKRFFEASDCYAPESCFRCHHIIF
jgi:hypothetical protein